MYVYIARGSVNIKKKTIKKTSDTILPGNTGKKFQICEKKVKQPFMVPGKAGLQFIPEQRRNTAECHKPFSGFEFG